jgi:3-dehydroquinate synthase
VSERLRLRHPGGETPIVIGEGALAGAAGDLAAWVSGRSAFAVTTPTVRRLHGEALEPLAGAARGWHWLEVEEGEAAKTLDAAAALWRQMLRAGGKRDSRVLAFGGGSVGDLAGFVASCFLRGVAVAQLPTTLLAQADAAIGGKTAIDLPEAKNSVGTFCHPDWVVGDTQWLSTLPREQIRSGLAETIKMAALFDASLLALIERDFEALLSGLASALAPVVAGAARHKIGVVERDPAEGGERALLNFGHTLGHALEAAAGYRAPAAGGLLHGDAVAWGMLFAIRLSRRRGLPAHEAARLRDLLRRLGPPPLPAAAADDLEVWMSRDKKAREGRLDWVLLAGMGRGRVDSAFSPAEIGRELRGFLADPWAV